nr:leucine-rich repeat domain-containing protein [Exiguobacterium sp. s56]
MFSEKKLIDFTKVSDSPIDDFVIENGYVSYKGIQEVVKIPGFINGQVVKGISRGAFEESDVLAVSFPDSVIELCDSAFYSCIDLEQIDFNEGLIKVGKHCFQSCESLNSVSFPKSLKIIESYAFDECVQLKEILFNGNIEHIGAYAFSETRVVSVSLPEGLTFLGNCLFSNCDSLIYVDLPSTLQHIGAHSFSYCQKLRYILIPENVESIGPNAFEECSNIEVVILPKKLPRFTENSFSGMPYVDNLVSIHSKKRNVIVESNQQYFNDATNNILTILSQLNLTAETSKSTSIKNDVVHKYPLKDVVPAMKYIRLKEQEFNEFYFNFRKDTCSELGIPMNQ